MFRFIRKRLLAERFKSHIHKHGISLVFLYLLACGAHIIGTVKRALCWPFTYDQYVKPNDKRTVVESKGAPTIFLKNVKSTGRTVAASAFQNGSDSVSTTISSLHQNFHWEGIAIDWKEAKDFKEDPSAMQVKIFPRLISVSDDGESYEEKDAIQGIKDDVDCLTLRQGTACWHMGRKFSLTSSQAHFTFVKAFPLYKSRNHWKNVAIYLYGPKWKKALGIPEDDDTSTDSTDGTDGTDGNNDLASRSSQVVETQDTGAFVTFV